jgi:Sporulation and spore germination
MSRRMALGAAIVVAALAGVWILFSMAPQWYGRRAPVAVVVPTATPTGPERKIKATLYYVSEDGLSLPGIQREIPFGEPIVEQARRIVEAQLAAAPPPYVSPVPAGTSLRALFIGERGDAFVDLSGEVRAKHPGGALGELFTVYAVVNAITVNLPAIMRVQILIDGKEADTLAGHVDLRHPLQKSLKWTALQTDTDK